jgi:hypothetical protein
MFPHVLPGRPQRAQVVDGLFAHFGSHVRTHMVDSFASSPADTQVPIICIHPSILDGCDHRSLESRISHKKKDARYTGVRVRVNAGSVLCAFCVLFYVNTPYMLLEYLHLSPTQWCPVSCSSTVVL